MTPTRQPISGTRTMDPPACPGCGRPLAFDPGCPAALPCGTIDPDSLPAWSCPACDLSIPHEDDGTDLPSRVTEPD
jgi:hypothetical protein